MASSTLLSLQSPANVKTTTCTCRDLALAAQFASDTTSGPQIGSQVPVTVTEEREYGLVCNLPQGDSFVGLIAPVQRGTAPATAASGAVRAVVLDVHSLDGIVDLSARQVRFQSSESKHRWMLSNIMSLALACCCSLRCWPCLHLFWLVEFEC